VKVIHVQTDEEQPGFFNIFCSMRAVDQITRMDLEQFLDDVRCSDESNEEKLSFHEEEPKEAEGSMQLVSQTDGSDLDRQKWPGVVISENATTREGRYGRKRKLVDYGSMCVWHLNVRVYRLLFMLLPLWLRQRFEWRCSIAA
jgi:hypothetical protein